MKSDILEKIGLSKNESKIYMALVKLGSASVNEISKIADVHRVNIYDTLERLQEKGLVASVMKSNKKYFEAASPEVIRKLAEEKEKQISEVKSMFPILMEEYKSSKKRQEVHSFKGLLGIKTVLKDILDTKPKELLNFASTRGLYVLAPTAYEIFEEQRIKNKIFMKVITSSTAKRVLPRQKLQEFRFLEEDFNHSSSTLVYANRVAIFMWTEDPIVILIESAELAESYRNYFYSLWARSKKDN
jgi:sugar-specific transcriptional regulator TrmB